MLTYFCKPHPQFPLFRRLRLALFIGCFLLGQTCIAQNFAYVTNSGSGTVSVIDTTTDTVTATVTVGSRPFGVAANSTRVYVTNSGSNDVSVIDTSNNTVVATIPVGLRPLGVAVNPQGTRAYVANSGSGSLSIIDASTNTVITTLIINGGVSRPFGDAVNPQGNKVYLSDFGNLQIVVIDPATNSVSNELNLDGCPFGIATSSAQEYVAIGCAFGFEIFDPSGSSVIGKTSLGDGRFAIAVNPAGTRVYLTDDGNASSNVAVLDAGGTILTKIPTECSEGVSVTPDGKKVYVANCITNSVAVIDANTNTIVNTIQVGSTPEAFGQFIATARTSQCTTGTTILNVGLPQVIDPNVLGIKPYHITYEGLGLDFTEIAAPDATSGILCSAQSNTGSLNVDIQFGNGPSHTFAHSTTSATVTMFSAVAGGGNLNSCNFNFLAGRTTTVS
jgi:YVTN family beta-propeller protein